MGNHPPDRRKDPIGYERHYQAESAKGMFVACGIVGGVAAFFLGGAAAIIPGVIAGALCIPVICAWVPANSECIIRKYYFFRGIK